MNKTVTLPLWLWTLTMAVFVADIIIAIVKIATN